MIDTIYIVVETTKSGDCYISNNNKTFITYQDAEKYRDLKRELSLIENNGYKYNVCSFNLVGGKND
jgi:hypothetical protein